MTKKNVKFIDFFAGAGGFSEGFLQAETKDAHYDFLLASDINENCEVTHVVRYKHQLGLENNKFLRKDITDEDFIHNLKEMLGGEEVEVITGGPPCQSFSLAGRRRTFDKKDDLFRNYLNVVRELKPKYFVMENVKGILTKYDGEVVQRIKRDIAEILDVNAVTKLEELVGKYADESKRISLDDKSTLDNVITMLKILSQNNDERIIEIQKYFLRISSEFTNQLPRFCSYHLSKTDRDIATVRHGFKMLSNALEWNRINSLIMKAKSAADIDNDYYIDGINSFLSITNPDSILNTVEKSLEKINHKGHLKNLIQQIRLYQYSVEEYVEIIKNVILKDKTNSYYEAINLIIENGLNLYRLNGPMVLLASDYGVPQNRERVIFLGCRKDQPFISSITKTTPTAEDKVTVFEALHDLDNIGVDEVVTDYADLLSEAKKFNQKFVPLLKSRTANSCVLVNKKNKTYSDWSREGRLNPKRFKMKSPSFCENYNEYTNQDDLSHLRFVKVDLHNHQTSNHSPDVQKRLSIIRKHGDYKKATFDLKKSGVDSKKRNYTPFTPEKQSTTIMTIADDYVHYRADRAPTVREMARLQSFDDSFVFQGKRTTGGDRRKDEIPQFTLVGNAVPPLMARAIADEILKHIQ